MLPACTSEIATSFLPSFENWNDRFRGVNGASKKEASEKSNVESTSTTTDAPDLFEKVRGRRSKEGRTCTFGRIPSVSNVLDLAETESPQFPFRTRVPVTQCVSVTRHTDIVHTRAQYF